MPLRAGSHAGPPRRAAAPRGIRRRATPPRPRARPPSVASASAVGRPSRSIRTLTALVLPPARSTVAITSTGPGSGAARNCSRRASAAGARRPPPPPARPARRRSRRSARGATDQRSCSSARQRPGADRLERRVRVEAVQRGGRHAAPGRTPASAHRACLARDSDRLAPAAHSSVVGDRLEVERRDHVEQHPEEKNCQTSCGSAPDSCATSSTSSP